MAALKYWIWLCTRGKGLNPYANAILHYFGTPEAAYAAPNAAMDEMRALPEHMRAALKDKNLEQAERILADCATHQIRVLTIQDTEYPERLRQIDLPPCLLYVKGQLPQIDEELAIAIVGAREATPYGEHSARRFAMDLARRGALVISGIARGVDSAALTGALVAGGRVVSVLGNGIDHFYPSSNRALQEDIPKSGVLLSEYPPGTQPDGAHFPVRNRIISALSLGVLVVEGGERSGSLITARQALEQNRDVFGVPGNWDAASSRAPNLLIQRGEAKLVLSAEDILQEYQHSYPHKMQQKPPLPEGAARRKPQAAAQPAKPQEPEKTHTQVIDLKQTPEAVTDDERLILLSLQDRLCTADAIIEETKLPAKRVLSALTMLQVRALVVEEAGKRFRSDVMIKQ